MNQKQLLIQAFKSLDFEALENLLDDNRSYMDVSKDLFLSTIKEKIGEYENLKEYEEMIEGTCNSCYKGCKAYKFKAQGFPSLNLFFEEKDEKVIDIYRCNHLKVASEDKDDESIYFRFYKDEKVSFKPTHGYFTILQRIDKAVADFNKLESLGLVSINEIKLWYDSMQPLANGLNLGDPFVNKEYKAFLHIETLYESVSSLIHNYNKNKLAEEALREYHKLDKEDEKMMVAWLLKYKHINFQSLKKTDNWEQTGILILETQPNLVIDCSDFLDCFLYLEIYRNLHDEIMAKYAPNEDHFDQNGGWVVVSLENYLKLHHKYLDLL